MSSVVEATNSKRRQYGEHLTSTQTFNELILPEIRDSLYSYVWVDMFAGEGNLILPLIELIPPDKRVEFFKRHIFLFDIQEEMVKRCIANAVSYGISREMAEKNILQKDTIEHYPEFILNLGLPVYHITNPPYLYIGYIVKHPEMGHLKYFVGENEGYQDLYQLALMNDLRHGIRKMIYIIPSNFLFGFSASNKIRDDFLKYYTIKKAIIFERKIFEHTGTNVAICFFERKAAPRDEVIRFEGIKINDEVQRRVYELNPKAHYRAGNDFEEFVRGYRAAKPLKISYYLTMEDVERSRGDFRLEVVDVNAFKNGRYEKKTVYVNEELYKRVKSNILFVRTVDTGTWTGRAGLYVVRDVLDVDGILVSKAKYRTHPIQIFIEPQLSLADQALLKDYFNLVLEYFRHKTDSEFMTTYKYSDSEYIRKYLGLSQAKDLIRTFPLMSLDDGGKATLRELVESKNQKALIELVKSVNQRKGLSLWL